MTPRKPKAGIRIGGDDAEIQEDEERMPSMPGETDAVAAQADADVEDLISELGSGVRLRISRITDTGSSPHVGEMKADDFSIDALADIFGGGNYWIRVFRGKDQIAKYRVEIDPAIPMKNPRAPKGGAQQATTAPTDILMALMTAQAESSRRTTEMMMAMMANFSTTFTNMMQARKDADPMDMVAKVLEVTRPLQREPRPFSEFLEAAELLDKVRGDRDGGGDGTTQMISKAIDVVGDIAKRAPPPRQIPRPIPPGSVTTLPPSNPPNIPATPEPESVVMRPWVAAVFPFLPSLRPLVGTLEPATVADIIEQKLRPEDFADLASDITAGKETGAEISVQSCMAWARGAAQTLAIPDQYVPWLAAVAVEVVEIANDNLGEDDDAGNNEDDSAGP